MSDEEIIKKTPIAVFAYNRPKHISLALNSLSQCARLDECQIYIYCDGPRNPEHIQDVNATRDIVQTWANRLDAKVIYRQANMGLSRSIVTGVTELCETYGRVIVLEDDLIVSSDFIDYMLQGLDKYQNETEVYQISGYMFPVNHPMYSDTFFVPLIATWGWATWDRAWRIFNSEDKNYKQIFNDSNLRRSFNLDNSYPYSKMLEQRLSGKNDSWGILWWYAVFKNKGLVLYPRISLVENRGFDDTGVHCRKSLDSVYHDESKIIGVEQLSKPIKFPDKVIVDQYAFNIIKTYLRKINYPVTTIIIEDVLTYYRKLLTWFKRG